MAFYVRFFNSEILLQKEQEILPYVTSLNMLSPRELDIVASYIGKLKSGTNRIYLDKNKKKYLLAIGTDKTDIREFQKNTKKEAKPAVNAVKPKVTYSIKSVPVPVDVNKIYEGWKVYAVDYQRIEESGTLSPYTFRAKIKDVNLLQAYEKLTMFLKDKHGDKCNLPEFYPELIRVTAAE